jgi:hypothetical protein
MLPNPQPYFANLPDPRRETKNKLHKLEDIVMSVLCAVLSGIESSSENNTLAKAIERGDRHVITTALKSGKAQIKKR